MKVVYVAGPFRGATPWRVELNVRRAEEEALNVWKLGAVALCPHTNSRNFEGECPDSTWINGTLELLRRCDAIFVLDGWKESKGTQGEIAEAEYMGLPIFFFDKGAGYAALGKWIAEPKGRTPAEVRRERSVCEGMLEWLGCMRGDSVYKRNGTPSLAPDRSLHHGRLLAYASAQTKLRRLMDELPEPSHHDHHGCAGCRERSGPICMHDSAGVTAPRVAGVTAPRVAMYVQQSTLSGSPQIMPTWCPLLVAGVETQTPGCELQ